MSALWEIAICHGKENPDCLEVSWLKFSQSPLDKLHEAIWSTCQAVVLCHISVYLLWFMPHLQLLTFSSCFFPQAAPSQSVLYSALGNHSQGLATALHRIYNCEFWQSFTYSSAHAVLAMHRDFRIKNTREGKFVFPLGLCMIYLQGTNKETKVNSSWMLFPALLLHLCVVGIAVSIVELSCMYLFLLNW